MSGAAGGRRSNWRWFEGLGYWFVCKVGDSRVPGLDLVPDLKLESWWLEGGLGRSAPMVAVVSRRRGGVGFGEAVTSPVRQEVRNGWSAMFH